MTRFYRRRSLVYASVMLLLILVVAACGGDEQESGGGDNKETNETDRPNQLAFVLENEDDVWNLMVADADGSNQHVVAEDVDPYNRHFFSWTFLWSPDGNQIAYINTIVAEGKQVLYVVDADGSNRRSIAEDYFLGFPIWSPDSRRIAFYSDPADGPRLRNIIDADGSNHRTFEQEVFQNVWSPDGSMIASSDSGDIYVTDNNGENARTLYATDLISWELQPVWSPDGSQISFVLPGEDSDELMVMDADGENLHSVIVVDGIRDYLWSPDRNQLLYYNSGGIYIVDSDGTNQRDLSSENDSEVADNGIAWLPDGDEIVFSSFNSESFEFEFTLINVETGESQQLQLEVDGNTMLNGAQFNLSPDGRQLVMFGRDGDTLDTLGFYIMNIDGSNIHRIADAYDNTYIPVWRPH
jgi:Tol biopolymer transport system component